MEDKKRAILEEKNSLTEKLRLDWLAEPSFWGQLSDEETEMTPLVIVLPSGRAENSTSEHLALVSDALYTHQIVAKINSLSIEAGKQGIQVRTLLDVDYYELLGEFRQMNGARTRDGEFIDEDCGFDGFEELQANLLVIAGTNINIIARELLNCCSSDEIYGIGYTQDHNKNSLVSGNGKCYTITAHQHVGILAAYWQPWAGSANRIAIHCGGLLAPGTASSNFMLLNYLNGKLHGNNKFRDDVPVKIFDTPLKEYRHTKLLDPSKCMPKHDMRNIIEELHIHE